MAYTPFTKDDQPTMQAFNDAFEGAVQDSLRRGLQIETGSYVGDGTYGGGNPCSIAFKGKPYFVAVAAEDHVLGSMYFVRNAASALAPSTSDYPSQVAHVEWTENVVSWNITGTHSLGGGTSTSIMNAKSQLNASGQTYHYFGLCESEVT